ncbi:hypothetical protein ACHAQA_001065 [Verticillium albo-atrum]
MKAATSLAVCLAALTPLASAWPKWLPEVDALIVRQNDGDSTTAAESASAEASADASAAETTPAPRTTGTGRNTESGSAEETGTTTGRRGGGQNTAEIPTGTNTRSATRTTSFDDLVAAGGIQMMTPAATDPALKLYKAGNDITLGWNYTEVLAQPTGVDVLVSMANGNNVWTITQNMTYSTKGNNVIWETKDYATAGAEQALANGEYTLVVYDSDEGPEATPRAGFLSPYDSFTFDIYLPNNYEDLKDGWTCPTCNAGVPGFDSKALGFAMTMSVATVASFTWFVSGTLL